ncbi:MAG: UvrD-helicase domain-containing protein [Chthonomonas sp.]|nr:UvrD-helicase domain-containing protein [Chthonomonas sp.]
MENTNLTPEQQAVVDSDSAQLTVLAAAGSGKTRTLVARYLRHVTQDGMRPDQILTITFTRKAATQMKRRIVKELLSSHMADEAQIAETGPIQTIHSFCERLLRENAVAAGIDPKFEVMEGSMVGSLMHRGLLYELVESSDNLLVSNLIHLRSALIKWRGEGALEEQIAEDVHDVLNKLRGSNITRGELAEIYQDPSSLRAAIEKSIPDDDRKKQQIVDGLDASAEDLDHTCALMQLSLGVWRRFEDEMAARQAFDFAELERRAVNLVETNAEVAARARRQYKVVLVDEAQDLNPLQYRLLTSLQIGIEMLVGDPQQSIYGFRQADYKRFVARAEETETMRLSGNYRSSGAVLDFVDELFTNWWKNRYSAMEPKRNQPGEVQIWQANKYDKSVGVEMVQSALEAGFKPGEIAILVRTDFHARQLPERLAKVGIQSRVLGGAVGYYSRMHVRDLANLLDALANPESNLTVLSLLHSPIVGLSLDSIVELAKPAQKGRKILVWELSKVELSNPEDQIKLNQFLEWFDPLRKYADRLTAWEVLSEVFRSSTYLERIARQPNARQSIANTRKLLELAVEDRELGPAQFAEKIRMIQRMSNREGDAPAVDDNEDTVKIMTMHKAKGLEFPVVIVPTLSYKPKMVTGVLVDQESGLVYTNYGKVASEAYQYAKKQRQQSEADEEQRVLYVAFTRAADFLMLCTDPGEGLGSRIANTMRLGNPKSKWKIHIGGAAHPGQL